MGTVSSDPFNVWGSEFGIALQNDVVKAEAETLDPRVSESTRLAWRAGYLRKRCVDLMLELRDARLQNRELSQKLAAIEHKET